MAESGKAVLTTLSLSAKQVLNQDSFSIGLLLSVGTLFSFGNRDSLCHWIRFLPRAMVSVKIRQNTHSGFGGEGLRFS